MDIENTRPINQAEPLLSVEKEESGIRKTEIFFGLIMAVAAFAGIWGAVSLLISWFLAN